MALMNSEVTYCEMEGKSAEEGVCDTVYGEGIMQTYTRQPVRFASGNGSWLYDEAGTSYLDFVAGVAVNTLGHGHPALVGVVQEQAEKLLHVSNLFWTQPQEALAKRLTEVSGMEAVFFCNSGTEAVEGALKLARKYGKKIEKNKVKVLSFTGSFHGRTMGALSVTGNRKYQEAFEPLIGGSVTCDFNNMTCVEASMDDQVCAVIVEPIQGEGGIIPAQTAFLKGLRNLCDQHKALLIFDEVQCGMGRTGHLFAADLYGVQPDVICLAKGLGGGLPIGAFLCTEAANVLEPGDHGSTYGGNPLVCAGATAILDVLLQDGVLGTVADKGKHLKQQLDRLQQKYSDILSIRGAGLMMAMELNRPIKAVVDAAFRNQLLLIGAGERVIRFVPPLTVSHTEIDQCIERLDTALHTVLVEGENSEY